MKRLLIVVDMQNDFVDGALGTPEARAIVPRVRQKVTAALAAGETVVFTRDTHTQTYLDTAEGKKLPVPHCVKGTWGWELIPAVRDAAELIFDKPTFGSIELAQYTVREQFTEMQLIGLCTDICVISNALLLKASLPEAEILVDAACCAGVTPQSHANALNAMQMCQITII